MLLVFATGFSHMVYECLCSRAASLPCVAAQSAAVIAVLMSVPGQAYWSTLSLLWLLPRVIICLDMTSNLRRFPQHFDDFVHCLSMLKLLMRSLLLYNLRNLFFLGWFQDSFLILMVWIFYLCVWDWVYFYLFCSYHQKKNMSSFSFGKLLANHTF